MFGSVSLQTVSCLSFIFYLYHLGSFQSLITVEKTCTFFFLFNIVLDFSLRTRLSVVTWAFCTLGWCMPTSFLWIRKNV